jgi:putative Mg2+ transporter-C (MgtC) family protein
VEPVVSNLDVLARIGLALLLGGLVGLDRELSHQPAGLRTHITVAVGAALFGVISVHGFDAYVQPRANSNYQVDVTRVASQVVVGIGFLGAGAILKDGATVRGLTTAASLWVTAAVGLAAGIGSMVAATITTAALLVSLEGLRMPRRWMRRRLGRNRVRIVVELAPGADAGDVVRALVALPLAVRAIKLRDSAEGVVIDAEVVPSAGGEASELLAAVLARPDVRSVDLS